MTVKALKKQLAAAIAMVVVSGVALSSSTYAWFANNNKVTATGMTVNATSDSSIVIKGSDGSQTFGSIGTSTISKTSMHPSSSSDGVNFAKLGSGVKVEKTGESKATWTGDSNSFNAGTSFITGDLVTATNSDSDIYYLEATYTVKAINANQAVYLKDVSLTSSSNLKGALRASITLNGITLVYNLGEGSNAAEGVAKKGDSAWGLAAASYVTADKQASTFGTLTKDTEYTMTVHIWFEGQDTTCYTDKLDANNSSVTVELTTQTPAS